MDRITPTSPAIRQLIADADAARACLTTQTRMWRQRLNLPARVRHSLAGHPAAWMLGSLAAGWLASRWLRRPHKPPPRAKSSGKLAATLVGLTLTAAKPLAKVWLGGRLQRWLSQHPSALAASRAAGRPHPSEFPSRF